MAHLKKQSECGSYNYLLYQPEGYDDAARRPAAGWPLLLFLHGADHKGVNLDGLRLSGIPRLCEERFCRVGPSDMMFDLDEEDVPTKKISSVDEDESNSPRTATTSLHLGRAAALAQRSPHRRTPSAGAQGPEPLRMQSFPFVVISPLCPPFKYWRVESLESLIEEVTERYSIDPRRIYAVGEGMGGWAACALAARMPRCLAACVPIGAATDPSLVDVERLKDTPLWIFHGSSRSGVDALGSLGESLVDCDNDTSDGEADESDEDDESLRATLSLAHALREHGARSVLFTAYPTVEAKPKSSSLSSTTTTTGRAAAHADSLAGKATVVADDENELVKRAYTYDNPLLYQWLLQHSLPLLDV